MKYALILITLMLNTNGDGVNIHASSSEEAQYLQRMLIQAITAAAQAAENDGDDLEDSEGPAAPPPSPAGLIALPLDMAEPQIGYPVAQPARRGIDFRRGIDWGYYR